MMQGVMPSPGALGPAFSADAFSLTPDPARLFPEYLAAVEQLAKKVDSWRP